MGRLFHFCCPFFSWITVANIFIVRWPCLQQTKDSSLQNQFDELFFSIATVTFTEPHKLHNRALVQDAFYKRRPNSSLPLQSLLLISAKRSMVAIFQYPKLHLDRWHYRLALGTAVLNRYNNKQYFHHYLPVRRE